MLESKSSNLSWVIFAIWEELVEDLFGWGEGFLFVVTVFAAGDAIAAGGTAAACDGDDMVERKIFGADFFVAIVADARGNLRFPPVGST